MDDTRFFNDALLAYAERTGFDRGFSELPIEEQSLILRDAQTLKSADRIRSEAIAYEAKQPMYLGEPHATKKTA